MYRIQNLRNKYIFIINYIVYDNSNSQFLVCLNMKYTPISQIRNIINKSISICVFKLHERKRTHVANI